MIDTVPGWFLNSRREWIESTLAAILLLLLWLPYLILS